MCKNFIAWRAQVCTAMTKRIFINRHKIRRQTTLHPRDKMQIKFDVVCISSLATLLVETKHFQIKNFNHDKVKTWNSNMAICTLWFLLSLICSRRNSKNLSNKNFLARVFRSLIYRSINVTYLLFSIFSVSGYPSHPSEADHITAMAGDYVVFNCEVNFPHDQVVPYVVQWWRKVTIIIFIIFDCIVTKERMRDLVLAELELTELCNIFNSEFIFTVKLTKLREFHVSCVALRRYGEANIKKRLL